MGKFLMICYVSAEFFGPDGQLFTVYPKNLGIFVEAPEWIKETLLYKWLLKDGSIKVALEAEKKALENEPKREIGADGKKIEEKAEETGEEESEEEKPKKTTSKKKKDDAC